MAKSMKFTVTISDLPAGVTKDNMLASVRAAMKQFCNRKIDFTGPIEAFSIEQVNVTVSKPHKAAAKK